MIDPFRTHVDAVDAPARAAFAVTPSDSAELATLPKAIYVGTGGHIVMRGADDAADRTWKNVPAGSILPFRALAIRASGTTAADLLALY